MLAKRQLTRQCLVVLFGLFTLLVSTGDNIAAQNLTVLNHQRARNLNREGYRAYRARNWKLALQKFAKAIKLDPYYSYPIYNMACVLSLRGRPQDSYRIYRLLLEVLLQESGERQSIHQAKMQKDPDLVWFRRHEPELFIMLNDVILDYDSEQIYRRLWQRPVWGLQTSVYQQSRNSVSEIQNYIQDFTKDSGEQPLFSPHPSSPVQTVEPESSSSLKATSGPTPEPESELNPASIEIQDDEEAGRGGARDTGKGNDDGVGYVVPPEERVESLTVTPDDEPFDPSTLFDEDSSGFDVPEQTDNPFAPESETPFDPFSGATGSDPFGGSDTDTKGFPGYDQEGSDSFLPFVPQSLRQRYQESQLTLNLVSQQARPSNVRPTGAIQKDEISFRGYRYTWRFQAGDKLFEMRGFFVIRGNVLILETFASSPKELENLPFDWEAYRSLFLIYQPQLDEFHAITATGDVVKIF